MVAGRTSETGMEIALQAIQGSLEGYRQSVENGIHEIRGEIREHVRDEKAWQERIEEGLFQLTTLPGRLDVVEKKVSEHEGYIHQAKGAVLAGKVLYALIGVAVALVTWLATHAFAAQKSEAATPKPQAQNQPTYVFETPASPPALPPAVVPAAPSVRGK